MHFDLKQTHHAEQSVYIAQGSRKKISTPVHNHHVPAEYQQFKVLVPVEYVDLPRAITACNRMTYS